MDKLLIMIMAGYSNTSLNQKLGLNESSKIFLLNSPENYFELVGENLKDQLAKKYEDATFIHFFAPSLKQLSNEFNKIIKVVDQDTIIWISWYKKSSGFISDVNENVIREIVLSTGWVDIKVCAFDEVWSGLKIVKRKALRK